MRKLVVSEFVSLDGTMEGPDRRNDVQLDVTRRPTGGDHTFQPTAQVPHLHPNGTRLRDTESCHNTRRREQRD